MLERTLRQPIVAVNVRRYWGVGVAIEMQVR